MSEKHYPYFGGSFDRIIFDGDGSVWVPEAENATLGADTCREVYLLMATDIGNGREEVLGVYATEEAAMAAINENQFGYALHNVRKWEVDK